MLEMTAVPLIVDGGCNDPDGRGKVHSAGVECIGYDL